MIARTLADRLKLSLGQAWIIDNRAGGSGQIGMPLVARAGPDGYTLAVSPASFLTTNKSIFKSLPYDPVTDFAPVSRLVNQPMVLVVNDKQKYPNVAALIAAARAAPGTLSYASSGDGSPQHLAGLLFETRTQTKLLHVPYRGAGPAITDLLGGQVALMVTSAASIEPMVLDKKARVLASFTRERIGALQGAPTMTEAAALRSPSPQSDAMTCAARPEPASPTPPFAHTTPSTSITPAPRRLACPPTR